MGIGVIILGNGASASDTQHARAASDAARTLLEAAVAAIPPPIKGGLDARLKKGIDRVVQLIEKPSLRGVRETFAPVFLRQVQGPILVAMFGEISKEAGRCRFGKLLTRKGALGAVVRLECDRAKADLLLAVDEAEPNQIVGFSIKPVAP